MTTPENTNHELITTGTSGLIRRMDQRLELVGRIMAEISAKTLPRIDLEMVRCFIAYPYSVELSKCQIIDDDAAEVLSSRHGGQHYLYLDGLTSLSDAAAESLSRNIGGLSLRGLTSLSDAAAESLSRHEGGVALS